MHVAMLSVQKLDTVNAKIKDVHGIAEWPAEELPTSASQG